MSYKEKLKEIDKNLDFRQDDEWVYLFRIHEGYEIPLGCFNLEKKSWIWVKNSIPVPDPC